MTEECEQAAFLPSRVVLDVKLDKVHYVSRQAVVGFVDQSLYTSIVYN